MLKFDLAPFSFAPMAVGDQAFCCRSKEFGVRASEFGIWISGDFFYELFRPGHLSPDAKRSGFGFMGLAFRLKAIIVSGLAKLCTSPDLASLSLRTK